MLKSLAAVGAGAPVIARVSTSPPPTRFAAMDAGVTAASLWPDEARSKTADRSST